MQTTVRFITYGSNSAIGNFGPGDVLRCGDAMARHLVDQAKVARYDQAPAAETPSADQAPNAQPRARKPRVQAPAQQALDVG